MAVGSTKSFIGINVVPQNTTPNSENGDLRYNSATDRYEVFQAGVTDLIVTDNSTDTLTNKSISGSTNTFTNIPNSGLAVMPANTVKANLTGSSAVPQDVSPSAIIVAGGAITGIGTLDSEVTPSADGASIVSSELVLQSASDTVPGLVNTLAQTFAGNKTINGTIAASNLSGSNTGDQSLVGDVVASGSGAMTATIQSNVVSNTKLATMPTLTLKGNATGSTANAQDLTISQIKTVLGLPTSTITDGQLPIGDTATNSFVAANITAGSGIIVTNAAGSLTIASAGSGSGSVPIVPVTTTTFSISNTQFGSLYLVNSPSSTIGTLPAASTAPNGFSVLIKKTDPGYQNLVINTNGSDSFTGMTGQVFNGGLSYQMYTQYEQITLVSNGVGNWIIVDHETNSNWSSPVPTVTTATTSAPTKAASPLIDSMRWRRSTNSAEIQWAYGNTSSVGTAGNGDYLFALPTGLQFDSGVTFYTTIIGNGGISRAPEQWPGGYSGFNGQTYAATIIPYDSTHFRVYLHQTAGVVCSTINVNYSATLINISLKFFAPISGWAL